MDASPNHGGDRSSQGLTLPNPFHRLSLLLIVLWLVLGVSALSHAQRFVRPINTIDALIASNPNDPHTNVFIPQGPGGPGIFYQWRKNDTTATNDNQSVLGTDWPGAVGRWLKIPIQQGSVGGNTGISNPGTNGFAVVNTLADLRNIPGNLGIGMVYIRGHSQAYDWGQGFFSRVDDCSTPDDDGLTSAHGNDELTCWTRENRFPWSGTPVQYAGGTVTRTLINTVSQYLSTQGGGTVFITDGQWAIDTTNGPIILRNSVSIAGSASAVLVGDGYGTMFAGTNIHNAQILELGISNVVNGVEIVGGTNILIGGNSFFKFGDGVRQYGGDDVRIEVNRFAEGTNGIHFSLDGAVKVTQGALIGNTFSGVVNADVLEDAGATDGYRRWDNGPDVRFTRKDSIISLGTNIVIKGVPGQLLLGTSAESEFAGNNYPLIGLRRDMTQGDADAHSAISLIGYDGSGNYHENFTYLDPSANLKAGQGVSIPNAGYEFGINSTNFEFFAYVNGPDRIKINLLADVPYILDTPTFRTSTNIFEVFNNIAVTSNTLPRFAVGHSGYLQTLEATAPATPPSGAGYWYVGTDSKPRFMDDSGTDYDLTSGGGGTPGGSDTQVQFNDGGVFGADADFAWDKTANTLNLNGAKLRAEGVDILSLQDGTDPQTLRIYGSTNSGTGDYARLRISVGGSAVISTEKTAGALNQTLSIRTDHNANLFLGVNGTNYWQVTSTGGDFRATTDNADDIGGNNAGRPANVWAGTAVMTPRVYWNQPTNTVFDTAGSGSPESVVTADPGSTYRNFGGGAGTSFYVKESGVGNTGWIAK